MNAYKLPHVEGVDQSASYNPHRGAHGSRVGCPPNNPDARNLERSAFLRSLSSPSVEACSWLSNKLRPTFKLYQLKVSCRVRPTAVETRRPVFAARRPVLSQPSSCGEQLHLPPRHFCRGSSPNSFRPTNYNAHCPPSSEKRVADHTSSTGRITGCRPAKRLSQR